MLRTVVEARTLVAMMVAACVGTWGLHMHPVDHENLFLGLIAAKDPTVFHVLTYGYATMWFSTPFFAASLALSMLAIVAYRHAPSVRTRALPPYPSPERRPSPSVVLGCCGLGSRQISASARVSGLWTSLATRWTPGTLAASVTARR